METQNGFVRAWKGFVAGLDKIGFSPLGLALLIIIAILPFIPPFNQEHMLRLSLIHI